VIHRPHWACHLDVGTYGRFWVSADDDQGNSSEELDHPPLVTSFMANSWAEEFRRTHPLTDVNVDQRWLARELASGSASFAGSELRESVIGELKAMMIGTVVGRERGHARDLLRHLSHRGTALD
jgi:hypothetical protein